MYLLNTCYHIKLIYSRRIYTETALPGDQGFVIEGNTAREQIGLAVTTGDINGDGVDDLIIGAPLAGINGVASVGIVYVIYGTTAATTVGTLVDTALAVAPNGFKIVGSTNSALQSGSGTGFSLNCVGNINQDGIRDFAVGSVNYNNSGAVHVIYGRKGTSNSDILLDSWTPALGIRIFGNPGNQLGASVGYSDVNNDKIPDLLLGAPTAKNPSKITVGAAYIIYGGNILSGDINLSDGLPSSSGFTIFGATSGSYLGITVASSGDINGDGIEDIAAGAPYINTNSIFGAGGVYIIYGRTISATDIDLSTTDLAASGMGFTVLGYEQNENLGLGLGNAPGDINNDRISDVLVGAPGQSYAAIIYGRKGHRSDVDFAAASTWSQTATGFMIIGEADSYMGGSGTLFKDINKDGINDLMISASYSANVAGSMYVIYGKTGGYTDPIDLQVQDSSVASGQLKISSGYAKGYMGYLIHALGAGDFDNDGVCELVAEAYRATGDSQNSEIVYVLRFSKLILSHYLSKRLQLDSPSSIDNCAQGFGSTCFECTPSYYRSDDICYKCPSGSIAKDATSCGCNTPSTTHSSPSILFLSFSF